MLWSMPADPRARRLGSMSHHRVRKVCGKRPSRPAAGRHQPVPQPPRGSGNCANCPIALSSRFPDPYYGAQEFPIVCGASRAISCRDAGGRIPITLAETAQTPGRAGQAAALFSRHRPGFGQLLGDLHRIPGRPLQELVTGHEQHQPVGVGEVAADAADMDIEVAAGLDRHREVIGRRVVDQLDARRQRQGRSA